MNTTNQKIYTLIVYREYYYIRIKSNNQGCYKKLNNIAIILFKFISNLLGGRLKSISFEFHE